jgi:hypothetical protein
LQWLSLLSVMMFLPALVCYFALIAAARVAAQQERLKKKYDH